MSKILRLESKPNCRLTNCCISRLFLSGPALSGIEKMRSIIFSKGKNQRRCNREARRLRGITSDHNMANKKCRQYAYNHMS